MPDHPQQGHASHQHDHNHEDDPDHDHDDLVLAELLDLDGQVLGSYWTEALNSVQQAATGVCRILDLGAGSGVGTIALAQRFGEAEVVAVDVSAQMLSRIQLKARELGLASRVRTVQADLNDGLPATVTTDLTDLAWASMSLHHLADPDRVLREVFATSRPGGLLAVAELTEPLRFLPDELGLGRPGLEARCLDALSIAHAQALPELGSQWSARLVAAGFELLSEATIAIEQEPPHPAGTVRYAQLWLGRLRSALGQQLAPDDLATLDLLIDGDGPASLRQRGDLRIRGARTVTLARRA